MAVLAASMARAKHAKRRQGVDDIFEGPDGDYAAEIGSPKYAQLEEEDIATPAAGMARVWLQMARQTREARAASAARSGDVVAASPSAPSQAHSRRTRSHGVAGPAASVPTQTAAPLPGSASAAEAVGVPASAARRGLPNDDRDSGSSSDTSLDYMTLSDSGSSSKDFVSPRRFEVFLERTGSEAWGFSWKVGAHARRRLIVASIASGSPAERWNQRRHASAQQPLQRGDKLVSVNGVASFNEIQQELGSAVGVRLRFVRPVAVSSLRGDGLAANVLPGIPAARPRAALDSACAVPRATGVDGSDMTEFECRVKNSFIDIALFDEEDCQDDRHTQSEPASFQIPRRGPVPYVACGDRHGRELTQPRRLPRSHLSESVESPSSTVLVPRTPSTSDVERSFAPGSQPTVDTPGVMPPIFSCDLGVDAAVAATPPSASMVDTGVVHIIPAGGRVCDADEESAFMLSFNEWVGSHSSETPAAEPSQQPLLPSMLCADTICGGESPPEAALVGRHALITGLVNSPEFNNCWCEIEAYDADMQRFAVRLLSSFGEKVVNCSGAGGEGHILSTAMIRVENLLIVQQLGLLADMPLDASPPAIVGASYLAHQGLPPWASAREAEMSMWHTSPVDDSCVSAVTAELAGAAGSWWPEDHEEIDDRHVAGLVSTASALAELESSMLSGGSLVPPPIYEALQPPKEEALSRGMTPCLVVPWETTIAPSQHQKVLDNFTAATTATASFCQGSNFAPEQTHLEVARPLLQLIAEPPATLRATQQPSLPPAPPMQMPQQSLMPPLSMVAPPPLAPPVLGAVPGGFAFYPPPPPPPPDVDAAECTSLGPFLADEVPSAIAFCPALAVPSSAPGAREVFSGVLRGGEGSSVGSQEDGRSTTNQGAPPRSSASMDERGGQRENVEKEEEAVKDEDVHDKLGEANEEVVMEEEAQEDADVGMEEIGVVKDEDVHDKLGEANEEVVMEEEAQEDADVGMEEIGVEKEEEEVAEIVEEQELEQMKEKNMDEEQTKKEVEEEADREDEVRALGHVNVADGHANPEGACLEPSIGRFPSGVPHRGGDASRGAPLILEAELREASVDSALATTTAIDSASSLCFGAQDVEEGPQLARLHGEPLARAAQVAVPLEDVPITSASNVGEESFGGSRGGYSDDSGASDREQIATPVGDAEPVMPSTGVVGVKTLPRQSDGQAKKASEPRVAGPRWRPTLRRRVANLAKVSAGLAAPPPGLDTLAQPSPVSASSPGSDGVLSGAAMARSSAKDATGGPPRSSSELTEIPVPGGTVAAATEEKASAKATAPVAQRRRRGKSKGGRIGGVVGEVGGSSAVVGCSSSGASCKSVTTEEQRRRAITPAPRSKPHQSSGLGVSGEASRSNAYSSCDYDGVSLVGGANSGTGRAANKGSQAEGGGSINMGVDACSKGGVDARPDPTPSRCSLATTAGSAQASSASRWRPTLRRQ
eukprot:TRINITY_DN27621_c0_g1_i1.p1 TRINITY_DN27621_c0_g1~~TRINITY_DN27621_c0_g1_i1.p1  ORF type:complete len:1543 (+),score=351.84 TRINITY_DN27621_c0_g1_i1:255-4631(+)